MSSPDKPESPATPAALASADQQAPTSASWMSDQAASASQEQAVEAPAVPPRDYSRDPRLLQYTPPPAPLPPNRTLPTFFRLLANILFWGGSATAVVALFYRRVVLPRLAVLNQRLAGLHSHHLSMFDRLALGMRALLTDNKSLYVKSAAALDEREKPAEGEPVMVDEAVQATAAAEEAVEKPVEEDKRMFEPVLTSLRSLRSELDTLQPLPPSVSNPVPAYTVPDSTRPSSSVVSQGLISSPTRDLLTSLEDLSTYISTQQFYLSQSFVASQSSRMTGAAAGTSVPVGGATQPDIAMQCRSEIRGLKGLLLNRRSFAFAPPAAPVPAQD